MVQVIFTDNLDYIEKCKNVGKEASQIQDFRNNL